MTLLIALRQPGYNAILADTRVSWEDTGGQNTALKTGLLFPGCIFGITGEVGAAREFIISFKEAIFGRTASIDTLWDTFARFAEAYPYRASASFSLLLSERTKGRPTFWLLESGAGLVPLPSKGAYAANGFGSGTEPLRAVCEDLGTIMKDSRAKFLKEGQPLQRFHISAPYVACLRLNERSLTFEKPELESKGVGGVFHFIGQDGVSEGPQRPAVYIFNTVDVARKEVRSWVYKVVAVHGGLYVEAPLESAGNRMLLFDRAARYDLPKYSLKELMQDAESELQKVESSFFFCGWGFASPAQRQTFGWLISTNGREDQLYTASGGLTPWLLEQVVEDFR